jgi:hypothetical protein
MTWERQAGMARQQHAEARRLDEGIWRNLKELKNDA